MTVLLQLLSGQNLSLGLNSGIVIGVPIPEGNNPIGDEIEKLIQTALAEAKQNKILGKDITPYVLEKVNNLTGGKSLESSILFN